MIQRRGIVLTPDDLIEQWIEWLGIAELNVLGLHGNIDKLIEFVHSEKGYNFLSRIQKLGISVEFEIHAMSWLLPREEFQKHPEWFRMDVNKNRSPDGNFCPSNQEALNIVCYNASKLANILVPTTNRYYLWQDDAKPWCFCSQCKNLSPSDQNLMTMNAIVKYLQKDNPQATLSYLAYLDTLDSPQIIKPEEGIFLEFAPIKRQFDKPLQDRNVTENFEHVIKLERLIECFGIRNAQVLEYWLDASLFSQWKRPVKKIPFDRNIISSDIDFYARKGFQSITSFGVYLDTEYVNRYGIPPVAEYGTILKNL